MASENDQFDSYPLVRDPKYYADEMRCFVPCCKKKRRDNLHLSYLRVPQALKETWCAALERTCPKMPLYVCGDHINIDEDCYKVKSGMLRLKNTANLILIRTYNEDTEMGNDGSEETMQMIPAHIPTAEVVHGCPSHKRDSASQCHIDKRHKAVFVKPLVRSFGCTANIKDKLIPNQLQQMSSTTTTTTSGTSTPTMFEVSSPSTSSTSSNKENINKRDLTGRENMLRTIKQKPKKYIGIPENFYWLVEYLAEKCALRELHIIVCLFKIKCNDDIERICDHFNMSEVTVNASAGNIFAKFYLSARSDYNKKKHCLQHLKPGMPMYSQLQRKGTPLPYMLVRQGGSFSLQLTVQCIIDCFEIQIEKLSDAIPQSGTYSLYKSCNSAKYLIACCPNGLVCFISRGYGGRTSDKAITESCGFADILPPGAVVLADRGFKGIEMHLRERNIKLLRPPSVSSKETPTKKEVLLGKVIASLRIHIERLIRRVREFLFLKPHSVVNHSHIRYLNDSVIIACALINLQDNLIKLD